MCNDVPLSPSHSFFMTLVDLYTEYCSYKNVFRVIWFFFIYFPKNNCPVALLSTVVAFSIEVDFSFILFLVAPKIGCFVEIFSTILTYTLEELNIVVVYLSGVQY